MWYFTWILGIGLAVGFGILNGIVVTKLDGSRVLLKPAQLDASRHFRLELPGQTNRQRPLLILSVCRARGDAAVSGADIGVRACPRHALA